MPTPETEPQQTNIVSEARELDGWAVLAMPVSCCPDLHTFENARRVENLVRQLVDEVERRDELIVHMHVHSGYRNNGYMQMTTGQKTLYDDIWNKSVKALDEKELDHD